MKSDLICVCCHVRRCYYLRVACAWRATASARMYWMCSIRKTTQVLIKHWTGGPQCDGLSTCSTPQCLHDICHRRIRPLRHGATTSPQSDSSCVFQLRSPATCPLLSLSPSLCTFRSPRSLGRDGEQHMHILQLSFRSWQIQNALILKMQVH